MAHTPILLGTRRPAALVGSEASELLHLGSYITTTVRISANSRSTFERIIHEATSKAGLANSRNDGPSTSLVTQPFSWHTRLIKTRLRPRAHGLPRTTIRRRLTFRHSRPGNARHLISATSLPEEPCTASIPSNAHKWHHGYSQSLRISQRRSSTSIRRTIREEKG